MKVQKRGDRGMEEVKLDKIVSRIRALCKGLDSTVDPVKVAIQTIQNIFDGISTEELDKISAKISESYKLIHPDYGTLAGRILVSNLHKTTPNSFSACMYEIGSSLTIVSEIHYKFIEKNAVALDGMIVNERDYLFDYFGYKTLENAYLVKSKKIVDKRNVERVIDRPQYIWMRVAVALWMDSGLKEIETCYNMLSQMYFTHATPTLFNSCAAHQQLASCFAAGTMVSTALGPCPVEKVPLGCRVATHLGNVQNVVQVHKNMLGNRKLYELSVAGTPEIRATGDHKFWALAHDSDVAEWVRVDELADGYSVMIAESQAKPTALLSDVEFSKFVGYICAASIDDGHKTTIATSKQSIYYVLVASQKYFNKYPTVSCENNLFYLTYNYKININLSLYYDAGTEHAKAIFDGVALASDCAAAGYLNNYTRQQLYHLFRWHGLAVDMELALIDKSDIRVADGKTFLRVISARPLDYTVDTVYTLGVANDHSYGVEGLAAQNCFLLGTGDSIEEIMRTMSNSSFISKWAGGIGISMHNIRAQNTTIKGTNGSSSGLLKQLKIYNEVARCWDQGGKRLGAFAIYLEPWHKDILQFLEMKLQNGADTQRARDLFYALWIPDLFVARVLADGNWSLFSEDTAPGLSAVYDGMQVCTVCGFCRNRDYFRWQRKPAPVRSYLYTKPTNDGVIDEQEFADYCAGTCQHTFATTAVFTTLYEKYEAEGRALATVKARDVLDAIITMQRESGTPYILFKDHVNRKSNQQNIGTIKSSNLCAEIVEWSSEYSYASCTLASVNLRKFVDKSIPGGINHEQLHDAVKKIVRNLNRVIDVNKYPVIECADNNQRYRPIGIGVQALADVFCELRLPFLSNEAAVVDVAIHETIYHAAVEASMESAATPGTLSELATVPHAEFSTSPAASGKLQFDMWADDLTTRKVDLLGPLGIKSILSGRYDWDKLRKDVQRTGLRNSLLVALMPTVSTSQIMGNNESFEPITANIYSKATLAGKFMVANGAMIKHLLELNLWNDIIAQKVVAADGSIQSIKEIPQDVREIYKTVWELSQRELMRRAAVRGAFVDQSASLNVYLADNSSKYFRATFLTAHEFGLKTGSYYMRSRAAVQQMKNNLSCTKDCNTCSA